MCNNAPKAVCVKVHGVGTTSAATQAASQAAKAELQPASAGTAAIWAPGTVPKVNPAAPKQATTKAAQPA